MLRDIYDRFYQHVYHEFIDGNEEISYYIGEKYEYTIDYQKGKTSEVINYEKETKKTTEQDTNKMLVILGSMVDNSIVFEKEEPKKNVKK